MHRDVSPPNILVSTDGDIKLCDFGIAKAASKVSRTESGALKGKIPYMSPEQAWGRPVDQRSDIYSLGAVLFEMATGQKLFQGDSELNVLEKVRAGEVVLPSSLNPDVPPALDAAVLKALARKPDKRYTNASDMLRDLDAVLRTYEPPPSSADIAAYVRSLEAEDSARREARVREAQAPAAIAPPLKKPAKPEFRISLSQQQAAAASPSDSPSAPPARPAPPAPQTASAVKPPRRSRREPITTGVFAASFPESSAASEKKRRARLYVMIAAATVVLAVAGWLVVRKPASSLSSAPAVTRLPATPAAVVNAITPLPTPSVSAPDARAIQDEAQRQLLARRKEMKAADAAAKSAPGRRRQGPGACAGPPRRLRQRPGVARGQGRRRPGCRGPTPAPAAEPPPTAPPRAPAVAPETAAEVSRGDLVGPGPGVVEPVYVSSPRIAYPPAARQQGITGKVVVLLLVNEEGAVLEAKLQQGLGSVFGVNEAVLASIRRAKFQPATKGGIPVKMWRTIVVDVKP